MSASVVRSLTGLGRTSLSLKYLPVSTSNFSPAITSTNTRWHSKSAAAFISASRRHKITGSCGIFSHFCTTAEKVATQAAGDSTSSETSEEIKKLNELLEQERKKAAEFQDKYMRALAENQNTISRMRKQIEDTKVYGIQGLVKDLLEFSDVLQSALESIPKEEVTESNIHLKNLHIGLTMVSSSLQKVFKKYGVVTIDPLGEKFNPNFHEALFQQEVENKDPGTVVAVSKVGFRLSDRVIRPALVGVAK